MDLEEIKKISCTDYICSLGASKDKKSNSNFSFFKSPFRYENTASLGVNERKNTWFDYGAGFGGDVIRLVMLCEKIDFKNAIEKLKVSKFCSILISQTIEPTLIVNDVKELTNNNLLNYLRFERKINCDLAKKYLHEIHFQNKGKQQYAIGFKNDKGGFELRNKFLKISTHPKWITTIKGTETKNIFEGFIDFLSAITYFNCEPKQTIIVLNSVTMISKIELNGILRFWGDNDNAGNECLNKIKAIDERKLFKKYKDFNEFLCAEGKEN
jgi:hypothetical protein